MTIATMREAARSRGAEVTQRSHRPQQRRTGVELNGRAFAPAAVHDVSVTMRAAEDDGGEVDSVPGELVDSAPGFADFRGIASVTETAYEMYDFFGPYTEVVSAGAFTDTLNRADLDVPLVLGHDQMRRIARTTNGTLTLTELDEGLEVLAPKLDMSDYDVAYIVPKMRAKLIDEMSFAFRIDAGIWSPDWTEYRIQRVDIHRGDVAIVGYGANPHTTAGTRKAPEVHGANLARARFRAISEPPPAALSNI